jgi:hypothetical protein
MPPASLGAKIVAFAREQQGTQVGDGECYDLADQALRRAGAKSAPAYGVITPDGDYIWGKPVDVKDAQPGDIVQFRGFTIRTTVTETARRGGGAVAARWEIDTREHHTAIVERNLGRALVVLEQNVEPALVVQRTLVPVESGTFDGEPDGTRDDAITTVRIAGLAMVYRPQQATHR